MNTLGTLLTGAIIKIHNTTVALRARKYEAPRFIMGMSAAGVLLAGYETLGGRRGNFGNSNQIGKLIMPLASCLCPLLQVIDGIYCLCRVCFEK